MSGGMESSLEALVFNCGAGMINLGLLVNNLWTWVAVVTAAVSFWVRIRSIKPDSGPNTTLPVVPTQYDDASKTNVQDKPVANPVRPYQEQATPEPDRTASTSSHFDDALVQSPTKGNKYYKEYFYTYQKREEEEERECDGGSLDGGNWVVVEEWRRPMKAAVAGWYSYQDRRVLDGSVVRLWDNYSNGCCRRGNGQGSWESRTSFKRLIN